MPSPVSLPSVMGAHTLAHVTLLTPYYEHLEAYAQAVNKPIVTVLQEFIEGLALPTTVDSATRAAFLSCDQRVLNHYRQIQAQLSLSSAPAPEVGKRKRPSTAGHKQALLQQEAMVKAQLETVGKALSSVTEDDLEEGQLYLMATRECLRLIEVTEVIPSDPASGIVGKVVYKNHRDGKQQPRRNLDNFLPYVRGPVSVAQLPILTLAIQQANKRLLEQKLPSITPGSPEVDESLI